MNNKIQNILLSYKIICLIPFLFSIAAYIYSNSQTPKNLTEIWIDKNLVDAEEIKNYSNHFYSKVASTRNFNIFVDSYREGFIDESNKLTLVNEFTNFWHKNNNYNLEKIFSEKKNLNIRFQYPSSIKTDVERLISDYIYYCFYQTFLYVTETSEKETLNIYKKFEAALKIQGSNINSGLLNDDKLKNSMNLELKDILKDQMSPIVMYFIFSPEYLSTQLEINKVLITELNKKKQTISEKVNSYSRDLKKEGNLKEMEITWSPITHSFTKIVNINKINYIIQGFILGLIISIAITFIKLIILKKIKVDFFK